MITKIVIADQDKVDLLEHWVNIILAALGFEDALVTDESFLSDFIPMVINDVSFFDTPNEYNLVAKDYLLSISQTLDIELNMKDYVWEAAQRLKDKKTNSINNK